MENSVTETIQRLFEICTGSSMRDYTVEEVERKLKEEGELYLNGDSPIDIIIKYKPNRSEDTSYLYTLTEDLEDEGYEVICLMQDHVKRLRSVEYQPDVRLELGNVTNEMKTFAIIKDIPVITDSHLNRDGARIIDNTSGRTKSDLTRLLGKSNIGESMLMLDNVDLGIILNQEYDSEDVKHMVFKVIKQRVKIYKDYVCIPYDKNNPVKLVEDIYSPVPLFKETLMARGPVQQTIPNTNVIDCRYVEYKTNNTSNVDDDYEDNCFRATDNNDQEVDDLSDRYKVAICPTYHVDANGIPLPVSA